MRQAGSDPFSLSRHSVAQWRTQPRTSSEQHLSYCREYSRGASPNFSRSFVEHQRQGGAAGRAGMAETARYEEALLAVETAAPLLARSAEKNEAQPGPWQPSRSPKPRIAPVPPPTAAEPPTTQLAQSAGKGKAQPGPRAPASASRSRGVAESAKNAPGPPATAQDGLRDFISAAGVPAAFVPDTLGKLQDQHVNSVHRLRLLAGLRDLGQNLPALTASDLYTHLPAELRPARGPVEMMRYSVTLCAHQQPEVGILREAVYTYIHICIYVLFLYLSFAFFVYLLLYFSPYWFSFCLDVNNTDVRERSGLGRKEKGAPRLYVFLHG